MRAGLKNKLVTIQSATIAPDSYGEPIKTWSTFKTAWANVATTGGKEFIEGKQIHAELTHVLTIRFTTGIEPEMRVVMDSKNLDVLSVIDPTNRKQDLRMMCREINA